MTDGWDSPGTLSAKLSVGLDVRSNRSDSDGAQNRAFVVCRCEMIGEYGECVVETLVALQERRY